MALQSVTPPNRVTRNGYDASISLHWGSYEIATYPDRFETYQFSDGETVIQHWPHVSGAKVASELVQEITEATR